jgi:outer membrane scaffolding protein for murein synthesis (MipA/OmpV family)
LPLDRGNAALILERMTTRPALVRVIALIASAAAAPAFGQSDDARLSFTTGAGLQVLPDYFGADSYRFGVAGEFDLHELNFGNGLAFGPEAPGNSPYGFGIAPSFRIVRARTDDKYDELSGLDDIDGTLELGLGLRYAAPNFESFADLRYGFFGHEGFVGEVGADLIAYPGDRLRLSVGPRATFGSERFVDTYFGISAAESAASGLAAHDPEGGLVSAGVEVGATWQINESWGLFGGVSYNRLMNDAADSPVTEQGSADQFGASIGLTRRFSLDF